MTRVLRLMPPRLLVGLALGLGSLDARSDDAGEMPEYVEEVVIHGRRPTGVDFAVVRLEARDADGRFVNGLTTDDFRLNDGNVRVESVVEVCAEPDLHFVVDQTVADTACFEPIATLLRRVLEAFPDARVRVSLLRPCGLAAVEFDAAGPTSWVGSGQLLAFLDTPSASTLGMAPTDMSALSPKHLIEQVTEAAEGFPPAADRERFLLLISDGFDGDPIASYEPCCPPICEPCVLKPTPTRVARESLMTTALARNRVRLIFSASESSSGHHLELLDALGRVWFFGPATDRTRLAALASCYAGAGERSFASNPDSRAAELVGHVRDRLRSYLIAFTDERSGGSSFLKIEVTRDGVQAVPERIGEDLLLGDDGYLVAHAGPRSSMPWQLSEKLFPADAALIRSLAPRLIEGVESARRGWSTSCPYLIRSPAPETRRVIRAELVARFGEGKVERATTDWETETGDPGGPDLDLCELITAAASPR